MLEIIKISLPADLEKAFAIRVTVFVEEQQVDRSLEYEYEDESTHFLATIDGQAVGTARWRTTEKGIKLERFAVLPKYRQHGVGAALLKAVLEEVLPTDKKIYLHGQTRVAGFYSKYGFAPYGPEFEEAGIQHYVMVYGK